MSFSKRVPKGISRVSRSSGSSPTAVPTQEDSGERDGTSAAEDGTGVYQEGDSQTQEQRRRMCLWSV